MLGGKFGDIVTLEDQIEMNRITQYVIGKINIKAAIKKLGKNDEIGGQYQPPDGR